MKKVKYFFALLLFIIALPIASEVYSQSSTGIIALPPYIEETIKPGVRLEKQIKITNQRGKDETIIVRSREVAVDSEGNYYIPEGYEQNSLSSMEQNGWLDYEPNEFFLGNGESQIVTVSIKLPADLPTKAYYTELAFMVKDDPSGENVGAKPEISLPLLANYQGIGEEVRDLQIVSFKTENSLYDFVPVRLITHIKNNGNVHIAPAGEIFISKDKNFSKNVESIDFNPSGHRVLSNAGRIFITDWNDGFLYKDENGKLRSDWGKLTKVRIGKYYAQLNLIWDGANGKQFTTAVVSFWVFPWQIFMIILILIGTFITIKYYKKWKEKGVRKYYK
ncbi:MAG: hypothetical protein PHS44_04790 [Candidatus Dojkabacteria bacterium]|nr:hypothetical protein [Candidatus Dojkabacteria bacterium]